MNKFFLACLFITAVFAQDVCYFSYLGARVDIVMVLDAISKIDKTEKTQTALVNAVKKWVPTAYDLVYKCPVSKLPSTTDNLACFKSTAAVANKFYVLKDKLNDSQALLTATLNNKATLMSFWDICIASKPVEEFLQMVADVDF